MIELFKTFKKEDFYTKVNLHIHSNYSDGIGDFDNLIEEAKKLNMKYISITDHNTLKGYENSKYKNDPILIKGVEFDCFYKMSLLHILGYGIKDEKPLEPYLAKNEAQTKNDIIRLFKSRHPKDVINAIHKAEGIAVLAHPCCINAFCLYNYVKSLKDFGLDGIETYYPYDRFRGILKFHSSKKPFEIAQKLNLVITGGSDEHKTLSNHIC